MGQIKSDCKTLPETALNTILLGDRAGKMKKRAIAGLSLLPAARSTEVNVTFRLSVSLAALGRSLLSFETPAPVQYVSEQVWLGSPGL